MRTGLLKTKTAGRFVAQKVNKMSGRASLGHAVLQARDLVGDEPFAVMLSDDIIDAETPGLKQLLDVYEKYDAPAGHMAELTVLENAAAVVSKRHCAG